MKRQAVSLLAIATCMVTACDGILDVKKPARVPASALDDPAGAQRLVDSVISDFNCAYARYVSFTGLFTDELQSATPGPGAQVPDTRNTGTTGTWTTADCVYIDALGGSGLYTPLSTARFMADDAIGRLERFTDAQVTNRRVLLATANAYAGYSYVLFGEGFCQAAFDLGPPVDPRDVFVKAEQRFTSALEHAGTDVSLLNFAHVGRARARLNLGKASDAVADARLVTRGYSRDAMYSGSSARRENYVFVQNHRHRSTSVDPRFLDLRVAGTPDPRVRFVDAGRVGPDGSTRVWLQSKYANEASPIRIASWNEAQLIIAEVEGGQSAVDRINAVREVAGIATFSSTDPGEIATQVREERRREFFLDGHRLGDMRRLSIPFDTGLTHKKQPFGSAKCLPLPLVETQR